MLEADNLEDDVVRVAFSLNFKMLDNGGKMVCDAPEPPPAPKRIWNVNDDIEFVPINAKDVKYHFAKM